MKDRTLAALAGVVTVVAALAQRVPGVVVTGWLEGGPPGWLPQLGTMGETATVYLQAANVVGPLVTWPLAVGLGYYAGRHADVRREYRRLVRTAAAGSVAAFVVVGVAIAAYNGAAPSVDAFGLLLTLAALVNAVLSYTLPVVVGALAGAALARFEADAAPPTRPTGDDADATPARARERAVEDEDAEARPAD